MVSVVDVGAVAVLDVLAGQLEVLHLQLDGGQLAAVAQRRPVLAASGRGTPRAAPRTGPSTDRSSVMKPSSIIASTSAVVPTLRNVETSAQVGVADDDVQPAVLLRVGVRLVAGVDDRALQRRLEPDLVLEEVGALADLEAVAAAVLRRCRPGRRR